MQQGRVTGSACFWNNGAEAHSGGEGGGAILLWEYTPFHFFFNQRRNIKGDKNCGKIEGNGGARGNLQYKKICNQPPPPSPDLFSKNASVMASLF